MNIEYVKCIKAWHYNVKVTIGKIYLFPNFIDDDGVKFNLSSNKYDWEKEFRFTTEQEYNKQEEIINKSNYYFY